MDGWMDGSPQMWIQSDILLKKAILEAGQSILPLPLVRNFRRLTLRISGIGVPSTQSRPLPETIVGRIIGISISSWGIRGGAGIS